MIREAREEDLPYVEEIARLTWEGHDYLPKVFHSWLRDGNFYVVEIDGKVVATAKLTFLPCKVGWMEGLSVHPSYRGRRIARTLHEHLISLGKEFSREGKLNSMMFSTYVKNRASIHLGISTGFNVVRKFYHLAKEPVRSGVELSQTEPEVPELDLIPVGWRFVKRCHETSKWLRENVEGYRVGRTGFFIPKEPTTAFTPFDYRRLDETLPGMEELASRIGRRVNIMVPEEMGDLRSKGFTQWELMEPDVLVFELSFT